MQTVLSWVNPNTIPVVIKIYRNTTEVDRSNPGTALVTLSNGETSWIDPTALAGVTYYYLVEVISASNPSDKVLSRNYKTVTGKERGPGPQILKYGDLNLGYFGTLTSAEFFTRHELYARFPLSNPVQYPTGDTVIWHKFVRRNKIIYIPETALAYNISWKNLYANGLVFGYDGDGKGNPDYLPATKVNQLKILPYNRDEFIIRLPTGFDDSHENQAGTARVADFVSPYSNEWEDMFQCIHAAAGPSQKLPNVSRILDNQIGYYGKPISSVFVSSGALCQETISAAAVVSRGGGSSSALNVSSQMLNYKQAPHNPSTTGQFTPTIASWSMDYCVTWWPLLELVE